MKQSHVHIQNDGSVAPKGPFIRIRQVRGNEALVYERDPDTGEKRTRWRPLHEVIPETSLSALLSRVSLSALSSARYIGSGVTAQITRGARAIATPILNLFRTDNSRLR